MIVKFLLFDSWALMNMINGMNNVFYLQPSNDITDCKNQKLKCRKKYGEFDGWNFELEDSKCRAQHFNYHIHMFTII